jgi:hypothetical protein
MKLFEYYTALVAFIEKQILPDLVGRLTGSTTSQKPTFYPFILMDVYLQSSPVSDLKGVLQVLWVPFSLICWLFYLLGNIALLEILYLGFQSTDSTNSGINPTLSAFLGLIYLIFMLIWTVHMYYRLFIFYRDRRRSLLTKVIVSVIFLVLLGILLLVSAEPSISFTFLKPDNLQDVISSKPFFFIYFCMIFLPNLFYFYLFFISLLYVVLSGLVTFLNFLVYAANPFPKAIVIKILDLPIPCPNQENKKEFLLKNLHLEEIKSLRQLARDVLDSTEKKVIPLTLFFSFFAIYATTDNFQNFVDKISTSLQRVFLPNFQYEELSIGQASLAAVIVCFVFGLMIILALSIVALLRTIGVQSIVIQSCTLVESDLIKNNELKKKRLRHRVLLS